MIFVLKLFISIVHNIFRIHFSSSSSRSRNIFNRNCCCNHFFQRYAVRILPRYLKQLNFSDLENKIAGFAPSLSSLSLVTAFPFSLSLSLSPKGGILLFLPPRENLSSTRFQNRSKANLNEKTSMLRKQTQTQPMEI